MPTLTSVDIATETVTRKTADVLTSIVITETTISASFERQRIDPATGEVIKVISSGSVSRLISAIKKPEITAAIDLLAQKVTNWHDADIAAINAAKAAEVAAAEAAAAAAAQTATP